MYFPWEASIARFNAAGMIRLGLSTTTQAQVRVSFFKRLDFLARAVRRAPIRDHDLQAGPRIGLRINRAKQQADRGLLVETRDNDRDDRHEGGFLMVAADRRGGFFSRCNRYGDDKVTALTRAADQVNCTTMRRYDLTSNG